MSLLQLEDVARQYEGRSAFWTRSAPVRAVDGVSLAVEQGRTLGLVGESGCGKSTTGRLALGLEEADRGRVLWRGKPLPPAGSSAWRRLRAEMQMVYQDPLAALDRRLTVAEQVEEPLRIHHLPGGADRVADILRAVGLGADNGRRYPHQLSGGQRQRAVLARALVTNPPLLVCDEPVSALDVSVQAQVINLLTDLQAERGLGTLFISHDLKVVRQVSHVVAVMYLGRVVEHGDPDTIFAEPAHPYAQALVSAIPDPRRRAARPRIVLAGDPPSPAARPTGCAFHPRCPSIAAPCRSIDPVLKPLPDGRMVACHVAHGDAYPARLAA